MNVIYQRELYRSEVCYELEDPSTEQNYALEMCLRNPVPGLLPCHLARQDGKLYLCWDMTSRQSFRMLTEGSCLTADIIRCVLEGLENTRRALEGYLIDPKYLLLSAQQIYLDAGARQVFFTLDFETAEPFREKLQYLAEGLLKLISHEDPEQVRLAYGFYRLSVGDTYDIRGMRELLTRLPETAKEQEPEAAKTPVFADPAMAETLESLLEEEEREREGSRSFPLRWFPVYGIMVFLLFAGMESVLFFRNGRHLSPLYLAAGTVLWLAVSVTAAGLELLVRKIQKEKDHKGPEEEKKTLRSDPGEMEAWGNRNLQPEALREEIPQGGEPGRERETETVSSPAAGSLYDETVYLGVYQLQQERKRPCLTNRVTDERTRIPDKGMIIGKMPEAADLVLPQTTVSRVHARIFSEGGKWYVEDLNSRNGTRVNGELLGPRLPAALREEDVIEFSDQAFVFQLQQEGAETGL